MSRSKPFYSKRDKAWYINFICDGKRKKRKIGDTKTEAYANWKASFPTGGPAADLRFSVVADKWLAAQKKRFDEGEVSQLWLKRICRSVDKWDKDHPAIKCSQITPAIADAWLPSELSSSYKRSELATIHQCLRWAHQKAKLIPSNPLEFHGLPSEGSRSRILSLAEHNAMCRASTKTVRRMLRIAWRTGCRPAELRELKWVDISSDFSHAELKIHKTVKKSGRPRIIYFPDKIAVLLRKIKRDQPPNQDFVFLNQRKQPFTKNCFVNVMRRLRKKCNIEGVTAYGYRHTYITEALKHMPAPTVAALAGHTNLQMLIKHYDKTSSLKPYLAEATNKFQPPK